MKVTEKNYTCVKNGENVTRNRYTDSDFSHKSLDWLFWLVFLTLATLIIVGYANVSLLQSLLNSVVYK